MAAEPVSAGQRQIGSRFGLGTVRVRTTLLATAVVAAALGLGSVLLVSTLVSRLTDSVRTTAQAQADQLADTISTAGPGVVLTDDDDRLVQILDGDRLVVRSSSAALEQMAIPYVEPGAAREVMLAFDDDAYLAVAAVADAQNPQDPRGEYVVVVAHGLDGVAESAATLTTLLATGVPLLVVLLALVIWRVVGRALAPVEAIRREVAGVSAAELHRRVPQPAADDEIGRLAETMNRMLARLENSRTRQQQFVADASHELRSPIASIRAHAEIAQSHPERASAVDLAENVLAEGVRMQRLVEDLLVLTRFDEEQATRLREPVDLDDILFEEIARVRVLSKVTVDSTEVSAGRVPGDAALLRRVVANLLDNAVRHARSTVRVVLRESPAAVELLVEDDGAGIPEDHRGNVFGRFVRLDDARARDAGGAGLGLAIVAEVVAGHDGTVRLTESPSGGASFKVRLPRMN